MGIKVLTAKFDLLILEAREQGLEKELFDYLESDYHLLDETSDCKR